MLALVLGEAASGKSEFAQQLAMSLADERYYIATMQVSDSESQQRIERHRQMRQGKGFVTLEQPLALAELRLQPKKTGAVALLECASTLLGNELYLPGGAGPDSWQAICDEGISVLEKMERSPVFALKYIFLEAVAAGLIAAAEWLYSAGKVKVTVEWDGYRNLAPARFSRKILFPIGLYALAVLVVSLNFGLMFDNVVWGDEAYTCNAIRGSWGELFWILTEEENHPPLHFVWMKLFAELFGYTVPVYHFASFVPFCMGIIGAVTLLRKRYGNLPAAFFVMISGLAAPCLEYNMEIRMYALAFLGLAGCYYCVSRILSGSRAAGWIGMVFWASVWTIPGVRLSWWGRNSRSISAACPRRWQSNCLSPL